MSALPCSSILPWLENGLSPFGVLTLTSVLLSSLSRSTHSICRPSLANRPSWSATSSGSPWNGAVVSRTSFFMGGLRIRNRVIPRRLAHHGRPRPSPGQSCIALRRWAAIMLPSMKAAKGLNLLHFQSQGAIRHAIQHPDPGRGLRLAAGLENAVRRPQDPSHLPAGRGRPDQRRGLPRPPAGEGPQGPGAARLARSCPAR